MLVPRRVSHYDPHPHANNDEDFEKLDEIYENVESVNERLKSAAWTPWIASQQMVFLYVRQAMGGECSKKYQQKWVFRRKKSPTTTYWWFYEVQIDLGILVAKHLPHFESLPFARNQKKCGNHRVKEKSI